mgnify:CR=1 FL=1
MPIKYKQGFTLPELLMTAAIMGYALSCVLVAFVGCVTLNAISRDLTTASTHAEYIMESIRNTSFASISTSISSGTWSWTTANITSQGLTAMRNESTAVSVSGTTLLDVTVTISWTDVPGRSRTKTLRTLISS